MTNALDILLYYFLFLDAAKMSENIFHKSYIKKIGQISLRA